MVKDVLEKNAVWKETADSKEDAADYVDVYIDCRNDPKYIIWEVEDENGNKTVAVSKLSQETWPYKKTQLVCYF